MIHQGRHCLETETRTPIRDSHQITPTSKIRDVGFDAVIRREFILPCLLASCLRSI
ncbi:hypothetical protein PGT21_006624 [Puccinia graminis f. sp. tritici]|uniref:Uncharacterized protein n=1 Tax=Puccinia graminis f. sp. tritici TaxID=56615 RepID=A0A5B0Q276_PUCGR|nr:hypothetical protein PGT21_006624 [Puccinia graminis f. sp. tritici]